MNDLMAKQDKLNRLYAQILKMDEDGKDFLKTIVTQAGANQGFPGMPTLIRDRPDGKGAKAGVEP
ncbi:hypothetical protein AGMMS4952_21940 [Spirochaetia bacterium]|nr:hypothetical protein AGMMS4952_21940 [Spirochaetia bacterium]